MPDANQPDEREVVGARYLQAAAPGFPFQNFQQPSSSRFDMRINRIPAEQAYTNQLEAGFRDILENNLLYQQEQPIISSMKQNLQGNNYPRPHAQYPNEYPAPEGRHGYDERRIVEDKHLDLVEQQHFPAAVRKELEEGGYQFPVLTLKQKQFAVNPGVPEFHMPNPDFLGFRLQEAERAANKKEEVQHRQDESVDQLDASSEVNIQFKVVFKRVFCWQLGRY